MSAAPNPIRARLTGGRSGFTILEILIATAILTIGLLGLLALFPVAMRSGKITIEETNAMLIAGSVEQAIRDGIQSRKAQDLEGNGFTYFLLQHDGVQDPLPRRISEASPSDDHYILFPSADATGQQALDRNAVYQAGKVFVFPETDGKTWTPVVEGVPLEEVSDLESGMEPNGGGNPGRADDDKDDSVDPGTGEPNYEVYRTYPLSNRFVDELLLQAEPERQYEDPISQYSFAFAIRPAYRDASLDRSDPLDDTFIPAGELYEVDILVFRTFLKGTAGASKPILRKKILVHR
jgi:prepilin-type N-terminal cleavage/methylation domain-containing protein